MLLSRCKIVVNIQTKINEINLSYSKIVQFKHFNNFKIEITVKKLYTTI